MMNENKAKAQQACFNFPGNFTRFGVPLALSQRYHEESKSRAWECTPGSVPTSVPLDYQGAVMALTAVTLACLLQQQQADGEVKCMQGQIPGSGLARESGWTFMTPVKARPLAESQTAGDVLRLFMSDTMAASSGNMEVEAVLSPADENVLKFCTEVFNLVQIETPMHLRCFSHQDDVGDLPCEEAASKDDDHKASKFRGVRLLKDFIAAQLDARLPGNVLGRNGPPEAGQGAPPAHLSWSDAHQGVSPSMHGLLSAEDIPAEARNLNINIIDPRVENTASLDSVLDKMCSGTYKEPKASGASPVIPQGIQALPALLQPPREVIQELQRRANTATERGEAYFPGNTLHPRFAPQFLNNISMVQSKSKGYYPQWGGFVNFLKALEIYGNALQCVVQPKHVLFPGTEVSPETSVLVPIVPQGSWAMYLYRITEIGHRFSSGTAMRYDSAFRAALAHRCACNDPSVVISQEILTTDRQLLDVAHAAALSSDEEQKRANKARQQATAKNPAARDRSPGQFTPWAKGGKGKGKGRLNDKWNTFNYMDKGGAAATSAWAGGNPGQNRYRPYGGFPPMVTPPDQGPFLPRWSTPQGGGPWGKGKGKGAAVW